MRWIAGISVVVCLAGFTSRAAHSSEVAVAIDRGLAFLVNDAIAWKTAHNCTSCHHAALVVWSIREAKRQGFAVDESFLAETTKWVAESGDGTTGVPRPEGIPKALNAKAVWYALALGADPQPDDVSLAGLNRMLKTVKNDQVDSGAWLSWPETRPPFFGNSDQSMTALASLSLVPAATSGDAEAKAALDKGIKWLSETVSDDDPQSVAIRLLLWKRVGRPVEECDSLVKQIKTCQNADGGWSQSKEMSSDAWATGQAMYALAQAGIASDDPALSAAQNYLIKTQRDDGSWPMTSRPTKPGGPGSTSLIPIVGAGSAWAVLGLVHSR